MMKALYREKGAEMRIEILNEKEVEDFIGEHADILDSTFAGTKMSDTMRRSLQESDYVFSGMKTFHELNEAFPSLLDDKGERKPFERFLNDVQRIDSTYNRNYLRSEYNFVEASSTMAGKWEQFEADGDDYYLQYRTAGDSKVRPEHAALDRVTLPQSDDFWDTYYPPNGWNCRCNVVQVLKSSYEQTPHDDAVSRGEQALAKETRQMFAWNPGKQKKTVPDYNPYTIRDCTNCKIGKALLAWQPNREICRVCALIKNCYKEEESKNSVNLKKYSREAKHNIYEKPLNQQFKHIIDGKKGGCLQCHVLKDTNAMDYNRVLIAGSLYADKEKVLIMPEIHESEIKIRKQLGLVNKSNPDLKVGDTFVDVKSPFSVKQLASNATSASKQGAIACITDDHCILEESEIDNYAERVFKNKSYLKEEVHFVINGVLYKKHKG